MTDFINTYMPSTAELDPEAVRDTRNRLEKFVRIAFPDLDLNPNTVMGDLIITPQSYTLAALETGMDRFMSDLNLGNVANNVIFNCDFVEQYLGNFAAYKTDYLQGSGVVRLVFNENKNYILDRHIKFSFDGFIFSIYLPYPGQFKICVTGSSVGENENGTTLRDTGSGTYFADIPVVGNSGVAEVAAGMPGLISTNAIPELMSVTALTDFDSGEVTFSLPQLAQRTRSTIYAASMNTRNSAARYVEVLCPFTEGVSAIKNGDRELLRDYQNDTGIASGYVDLYVRSKSYDFTEEQTLKLYYNQEKDCFEGDFPYTGQIYHFESVTNTGTPEVADLPHVIISTNSKGLGALAAYTPYEKLRIAVKNAVLESDTGATAMNSKYEVYTDVGGDYALFTARYQTDPMLQSIAQTVTNPDNEAVNTSVLVRGFIPVIIDNFEVVYVKKPGVVPTLTEAEQDIKAYIATLSYDNAYSDAEIARIMEYAGVKYIKGVEVTARVQWSVADVISNYNGGQVLISDNDYARAYTSIPEQTARVDIASSAGLRVMYPPASANITASDMFACSIRNIRYYLMVGAVKFREVVEHEAEFWEV